MNWITEAEAAKKMGIQPEYFRRLVKGGRYKVHYTAPNGRKYQYNEKDVDKVLLEFSTLRKA